MDILNFHKSLIHNYRDYIQSFLSIKDKEIADFVYTEINEGKLWPDPLIQFNPTFEPGQSLDTLIAKKGLHEELKKIFIGYNLYRHQEEAITLGSEDKEFIVTSGTGSGKSLTYIATIFNHVLNTENDATNKVQAVIVYPMNALINSQFEELRKFEIKYLEHAAGVEIDQTGKKSSDIIRELHQLTDKRFPITYAQYTGQEDEAQREQIKKNPPHIILTNYMMLELMMTRGGKDVDIRKSILDSIKYLVFDELHTYRGRQGSDVSVLIRRIKAAASRDKIICIGTSATMVSGDHTSLLQQKEEVARIASTIFGTDIESNQIVNEYLVRSITGAPSTTTQLKDAVVNNINHTGDFEEFENFPTSNWIEERIALEQKEGIYVRRKPTTIKNIASLLAQVTGVENSRCQEHVEQLLEWANQLNTRPDKDKQKSYLPYRIHQFIAQTGSVYTTLGNQESRVKDFKLDAGLYAEDKDTKMFPLVFSRSSGHEFYNVRLDKRNGKIQPQEFYDIIDEEDEEEYKSEDGYIFIQHKEDEEPIWDFERDKTDLPESWFTPARKDGSQKLKPEREERLPKKIFFDKQGNFSFHEQYDFEGWFISSPLMLDPTSGIIYESQAGEWTKVMKLGGEGRSTATTVLAFETITQLDAFKQPGPQQKLLSFTDNRQDASLQAGHFNDFIKVGQLRAAITQALEQNNLLDYTNITDKIFQCLNISQNEFAKQPSQFPGPIRENEDAFKDLIMYRLLYDLRRSWRVVLPNLEQCGLLKIEYKHLDEAVADNALWSKNELLSLMPAEERKVFLSQIFDFFRKAYALSFSMLEPAILSQNAKRIREKLRSPWTLDESERLELPAYIRLEKIASTAKSLYTESGGPQSILARYIRRTAKAYDIEIKGKQAYMDFAYNLFDFLYREAGWLSVKEVKSEANEHIHIYQLKVDNIIWAKGDKENLSQDFIRTRAYKPLKQKPNEYFQRFYQTDFHRLKPIEGREHTGQISNEKRKQREEDFRSGKIGALFCSPTMELGIDISDLSIVHMRNVPPSPANYAQRSGRAGRSGQAAFVLVYCSNYSAHDRHYFKHATQMVAGVVTPPRIDLINRELLQSHLYASILTKRSLTALNSSLGDLVDKSDIVHLPIKQEVIEVLKLNENEKKEIAANFKEIIADAYFKTEFAKRSPAWFNDTWIRQRIDTFEQALDSALIRWRQLYQAADRQIKAATSIIENRIYADDHTKKKEAYRNLRQAERQRDLLLNDPIEVKTSGANREQSEFYPYRYLAAEGFLPGYNFTRLPIRSFMENTDQGGEFISRPRFVALSEFGPRNVIYHDGSKYRVDRIVLSEAELKLEKAKIAPKTGYFLYDQQYNYEVDPIINEPLQLDTREHVHTTLIEMSETRAYEMQRITCQEEERTRKGYEIQTYFSVDGGFENTTEGIIKINEDPLLHIHYIPACRIFKLNLKWRASKEEGFTINLNSGYWQNKKQKEENAGKDEIRDVKLFTSDTANALYMQPIQALALKGGSNGVITLMFAIKRAIENYFQVEANEIGATIMGEPDAPNILIYEAAEGSLGVLSQLVDNPQVYSKIIKEAYSVCFYKNGIEESGEVLPATYDDLLSYYNQYYHQQIDRNLIRNALQNLSGASIEILPNKSFDSYEEQYRFLQSSRDQNSITEDRFLQHLFRHGLKLPDEAQPKVADMYVKPDFFYKPNVLIFCDGTPHDEDSITKEDKAKRDALKQAGYQVLVWYYREDISSFIAKRPDIFKAVKSKAPEVSNEDIGRLFVEAKSRFSITLKKLGE
ncbi:MAG: hypothetical protein BGO54_01775 [Sphingobacteriales bacterium 46-32]|nr:MAG: hypothetical protein BGO54_01775 [Sphingobacteriales bacterium 46-32]